ncbi:MAG: CpsD/CapB family tyrosine-protein kinase [Olegusella sp.]|nr:CpsD/CapB family tyrosine-protein kinase [Olegusella sp.]
MSGTLRTTRTTESAISALYANIRFAMAGCPIKTLVIASANQGDGKSYVAEMLAGSIATSGKKVLLVDADFHDAGLTSRLAVNNAALAGIIRGEQGLASVVVDADQSNMQLLGCEKGLAAAADLLGSVAAKEAFAQMATAFDYVIFDTPALDTYIDAAIVASMADATILVARAHSTQREALAAATDQLGKAGANLVGTVLNDADER